MTDYEVIQPRKDKAWICWILGHKGYEQPFTYAKKPCGCVDLFSEPINLNHRLLFCDRCKRGLPAGPCVGYATFPIWYRWIDLFLP